jgi:hypothetical protein
MHVIFIKPQLWMASNAEVVACIILTVKRPPAADTPLRLVALSDVGVKDLLQEVQPFAVGH